MTPRIRATLGALAVSACLTLAGCSSAQAAVEGCDVVRASMEDLRGDLADATAGLAVGDTSRFGDILSAMERKIADVAPQVSNPELSDVLDDMSGGIAAFLGTVDSAQNVLQLAESEEFAAATSQIEQAGKDLSAICG